MARSSSERAPAPTDDETARHRLAVPRLVVTRRIDHEFGAGRVPTSSTVDGLQRPAARANWRPMHARPLHGVTAKWPPAPPECDVTPTSRVAPSRPTAPASLAAWASEAGPRRARVPSLLGATVRALMEGAQAPANEASIVDRDPDFVDPAALGRSHLRQLHLDQLGGLDHVASSSVASHEIPSMGLDHREAFILSLVDGVSTIGELVDACGMDEADALALLCELVDRELVTVAQLD